MARTKHLHRMPIVPPLAVVMPRRFSGNGARREVPSLGDDGPHGFGACGARPPFGFGKR
jgi:hypothetical protein